MALDLAPYAARWVALIQDRVAGVGDTPEAARQMALHNRSKERVVLLFVEAAGGEELDLPPLLAAIRPLFTRQSSPVYLVGGAVRDALMGRSGHDLDFVVPEKAIRLSFKVADFLHKPAYVLDQERDAGRVVLQDEDTTLDFTRFRGDDLEADLWDRDFTINAMALPATATKRSSVIDPTGGLADLAGRRIRLVQPQALERDPVRALRAVRQALAFDFEMTPETRTAVLAAAPLLSQSSTERVRDEISKLLNSDTPDRAVAEMAELGLLAVTLPEIAGLAAVAQSAPHTEPVLAHTIQVLRWLVKVETAVLDPKFPADDPLRPVQDALAAFAPALAAHLARAVDGGVNGRLLLRLGALFHDVGKKETQVVDKNGRIRFLGHDKVGAKITAYRLRRLSLSNQAINHTETIVAGHMRPLFLAVAGGLPSRRAVYRYFRATKTAGLDIGLLSLADHLATYGGPGEGEAWSQLVAVVTRLFDYYFDHHEDIVAPPPLVDGNDLIQSLQIRPGPEVGRLLRLIQEAQAAGEIGSRDEALDFARRSAQ